MEPTELYNRNKRNSVVLFSVMWPVFASAELVSIPYTQFAVDLMDRVKLATGYADDKADDRRAAIQAAAIFFAAGPCRVSFSKESDREAIRAAMLLFSSEKVGRRVRAAYAALGVLTTQGLGRGDDYTCRFAKEIGDTLR
jgi:hypothetical protein